MSKCTHGAPQPLVIKHLLGVSQGMQEKQFAMSFSDVTNHRGEAEEQRSEKQQRLFSTVHVQHYFKRK